MTLVVQELLDIKHTQTRSCQDLTQASHVIDRPREWAQPDSSGKAPFQIKMAMRFAMRRRRLYLGYELLDSPKSVF